MKLSIVSTLFKSAPYIYEFYQRASRVAKELVSEDYEIILVNDGSPDNSLDIAAKLTEIDNHIIVIDLSRNFGHHKAMMTGIEYAKGERIFLIDSDLEEEPEWLLKFDEQMRQDQCDVVFGIQEKRKGSWNERFSGRLFYSIFNFFSGLALPNNIVTSRLMSKRYVKALLLHKEREVFLAGLWHITGFKQTSQIIKKKNSSETTYKFRNKVSLVVNSVTSFSNIPLISIFYFGIVISFFAIVFIVYLLTNKIFFAKPLSGWTSVMASIWLIGGMIISITGVVGIYLSKIFTEIKQRPYTIIRQIYGNGKE